MLICLLQHPNARMREVAHMVGITERAVQRIINELSDAGYLEIVKEGRRNIYRAHLEQPLRHPVEANKTVGEMLSFMGIQPDAAAQSSNR